MRLKTCGQMPATKPLRALNFKTVKLVSKTKSFFANLRPYAFS